MSERRIHTPCLEERLQTLEGAADALDLIGLQLVSEDSKTSGNGRIGNAVLFIAEALANDIAAIKTALHQENMPHNVLAVDCPLPSGDADA